MTTLTQSEARSLAYQSGLDLMARTGRKVWGSDEDSAVRETFLGLLDQIRPQESHQERVCEALAGSEGPEAQEKLVKRRVHSGVKVFRVTERPSTQLGGLKKPQRLVIELTKDGTISIRPHGKRSQTYTSTVSALWCHLNVQSGLAKAREKAKERGAKKFKKVLCKRG